MTARVCACVEWFLENGESRKESYCSMGIEFILQDKILESWCIAMLMLLYINFK